MSFALKHHKSLRSIVALLFTLLSLPLHALDLSQASQFGLQLQKVEIELDFEGDIRKTDLLIVDLWIREQLTSRLDGAIWIGSILSEQSANPILAGQDTKGGYVGLDLRFKAIDTSRYNMIFSMDYRYSETENSLSSQDIVWKWHATTLGMLNQIGIGQFTQLNLGVFSRYVDGRELASGNLDQNTDFEGKDSVFGSISLQFKLDRSGYMAIEALAGSSVGGRIAFLRNF